MTKLETKRTRHQWRGSVTLSADGNVKTLSPLESATQQLGALLVGQDELSYLRYKQVGESINGESAYGQVGQSDLLSADDETPPYCIQKE